MYGKCENCSEINYLIFYRFTKGIYKKICHRCFDLLSKAKREFSQNEKENLEKQKLRGIFGKMGE
jgi:hypothetical protein